MVEAERAKRKLREASVDALDLLQADNVGVLFPDEARDEIEPEPDRVDVPGSKPKVHACKIGACALRRKPRAALPPQLGPMPAATRQQPARAG